MAPTTLTVDTGQIANTQSAIGRSVADHFHPSSSSAEVRIQRDLGIVDADGRPKYGLHAARHFFASCMIDAGHLPKRLQEMMGHTSLQMTFDRYGHLFPAGDGKRAKMESAVDFLHATKSA